MSTSGESTGSEREPVAAGPVTPPDSAAGSPASAGDSRMDPRASPAAEPGQEPRRPSTPASVSDTPPASPRWWRVPLPIAAAIVTATATLLAAGISHYAARPAAAIAGVIVDAQNQAIAQASVEIVGSAGRDETDSSGRFSIPLGAASADDVRLRVTKQGYAVKDLRTSSRGHVVISLTAAALPAASPAASAAARTIAGHVSDARGASIAGSLVTIAGRPERYETTTSGNFRIALPPDSPDRVRLRVQKDGFADADDEVSVPGENIQVQLQKRP